MELPKTDEETTEFIRAVEAGEIECPPAPNARLLARLCSQSSRLKRIKYELACVKLQRDALLDMTWLDQPGDDDEESTKEWRRLFDEGWERKLSRQNTKAKESFTNESN